MLSHLKKNSCTPFAENIDIEDGSILVQKINILIIDAPSFTLYDEGSRHRWGRGAPNVKVQRPERKGFALIGDVSRP